MLWKRTIILVALLVTLIRNSTALDAETAKNGGGQRDDGLIGNSANKDGGDKDGGGGGVDDNETEGGEKKEEEEKEGGGEKDGNTEKPMRGKPLKASGLDIEVNKRLGSAMFTMMAEGNNQSSMSFGLAKIFEVDSAGKDIDEVKHVCKFDKDLKDNVEVLCEDGESEEGNFAGLDEDGNKTEIAYVVATRKCPLASCQAESAMITIKSYIIKSKGFICQPDCEDSGDENRTVLQSPVFNGTAKWDIVVSGWEFCDSCGENSDTVAERLKIFFTVDGKSKGKSTQSIKKKPKEFNWKDCEIRAGWSKKEDFEDDDDEPDDQAKKGPGGKTDEDEKKVRNVNDTPNKQSGGAGNKPTGQNGKPNGEGGKPNGQGGKPNSEGGNTNGEGGNQNSEGGNPNNESGNRNGQGGNPNGQGGNTNGQGDKPNGQSGKPGGNKSERVFKGKGKPKKAKGKCKPARSTSFNGKPEDQDIIGFTRDDGLDATMTFRMYPMAVIDDSEVIGTDTGFEGPNVEEIEETLAETNEKKAKRYMVITVKRFKNKMVYDPTGDMKETGGTADKPEENTDKSAGFSPALSLSLFIVAAVFLNAMF